MKQEQQQQQQDQEQQSSCRSITLELIRKRSEHNENLISNLEEIALHQEELTTIGTTLGKACGKTLQILLLQNNVISQLHLQEMKYFKTLEYLNLALNNVECITGFSECNEHLKKLDLTLNFIDLDTLESSMDCLAALPSLRELFMIGNPCCINTSNVNQQSSDTTSKDINKNDHETKSTTKKKEGWHRFRMYVISKLPSLEIIDGQQILRSERIKAIQMKKQLEEELCILANECKLENTKIKQERLLKMSTRSLKQPTGFHETNNNENAVDDNCDHPQQQQQQEQHNAEEVTEHCPEDRIRLSDEMSEQKAVKERNEKANQPKLKGEKEFEEEQRKVIQKAREREEEGCIKQCNEGKWDFKINEDKKTGYLTLDISLQKHLSSSLIDVDVHPTYISVIIKSKVLRLVLPVEVKAEESTAKRSTTTGNLLISMPKCNFKDNAFMIQPKKKEGAALPSSKSTKGRRTCMQQELLRDATNATLKGPVQIKGIISGNSNKMNENEDIRLDMVESHTKLKKGHLHGVETLLRSIQSCSNDHDHGPPPLI